MHTLYLITHTLFSILESVEGLMKELLEQENFASVKFMKDTLELVVEQVSEICIATQQRDIFSLVIQVNINAASYTEVYFRRSFFPVKQHKWLSLTSIWNLPPK